MQTTENTIRELLQSEYATDQTIGFICDNLSCTADDIRDVEPMKIGLTNISFKFAVDGIPYVFRYPGAKTDKFLNRACEKLAEETAARLSLDRTFIALDADTGCKISRYVEDCAYIDPFDAEGDQRAALAMLHSFHDSQTQSDWVLDFAANADTYVDILNEQGLYDFSEHEPLRRKMYRLSELLGQEGFGRVLCHNDTWYWNFLKGPRGELYLIDWEYAGMNYPQSDVANFVISLDVTEEQYIALAENYEGHALDARETRFYCGILGLCTWYWFVWALYQETQGTHVEDLPEWHRKAIYYSQRALEMYEEE